MIRFKGFTNTADVELLRLIGRYLDAQYTAVN